MIQKVTEYEEQGHPHKPFFQVKTPLGFIVRTTSSYWNVITSIKHPSIAKKKHEVKKCLDKPDEVRVSRRDRNVYLFYKKLQSKYICVVVKYNQDQSFIVTAYLTDKIKEGEVQWKK